MFVATCTISSSRDETATPVDWVGAVLIGAAVAVFVFGVIEAPVRGWTHPVVWGCMAAGVALAVAFVVVELRRSHPLLDVRLFSRPEFATGSVGITILFFTNFGFFFIAMQYMQLILGYSPLQTAFALTPIAVPIMVLGATMHLYLPKIGLRTAVALGLFLIGAGLFCMRYLDAGSTYSDLVWPFLITSTGIGLCVAPTTSAIMNAVPDEKQGVASAVNDTTREVGAAIGIAVAGSVLAAEYNKALAPGLAGFGDHVRESALDSLAQALAIAGQMGPQGAGWPTLPRPRSSSRWTCHCWWSPSCRPSPLRSLRSGPRAVDGEQFGFVQRLTARRRSHDELGGPVTDHHDGGVRTAAGDGGKHRAVDHP